MIHRSPLPDLEIPDEVTLSGFLLARASEHGDKPALIDAASGRTISYAALAADVPRVAAGFAAQGVAKGDVVAFYSANVPEYALAFLGVATAGGIVTTVNPLYTVDELTHQLSDCGASRLVSSEEFLGKAKEAAQRLGIGEVMVFGEGSGATPFSALLGSRATAPDVEIDPRQDVVVLPYSSGTTGLPKGVMLTHYNLIANLLQIRGADSTSPGILVRPDDTLIAVLPFFHIYGMVVMMFYALLQGATLVTMPRFDLEQFLDTLQRYEVSYAHLVPPIVLALAKHPAVDRYQLPKLRQIICGAAPLGANVAKLAAERLGVWVNQAWGMTELSPVGNLNPDSPERIDVASIGPCLPNTECKIVDLETGVALGPNSPGEMCVRGPQVMKGYLNNPEATAACIDPDGWLNTGDIAYADPSGYLYVVDRVKELIKYKGYQVAPAELEAVVLGHAAVADVAVIGVEDEDAGELPKALVVTKTEVSADEIMDFVAARVAPYKKIRQVEFVESIPKSPSGKILRRTLIERERDGRGDS